MSARFLLREKEHLIQEIKQNQQFEDVLESNWSTEIYIQTELTKSLSAVDEASTEREHSQFERINKEQTDEIKKLKREITVLRDKLDESDRICAQLLDAKDKSKKRVEAASGALSTKDRQIEQLKAERAGFVAQMSHEIRLRDAISKNLKIVWNKRLSSLSLTSQLLLIQMKRIQVRCQLTLRNGKS